MRTSKRIQLRRAALARVLARMPGQCLEELVRRIASELYGPTLDPDAAVEGADFVAAVSALLNEYGVRAAVMGAECDS